MSDLKISARATFDLSEIVSGAATARAELSSLGAAAGAGGRAAAAGLGQVTTTMAAVQSAAHATAQSITSEMTAAGQAAGRQVAAGMAQTTAAMSGASSAAASAAQSIQSQFSTAAAQAAAAMQASQAAIQAAMRSAAQAAGDTARATQDIRQSVERGTAATQQMAGQLNSAVGAASNLVKTLGGLYVVNQAVDKLSELPKIGVASAANMEVMQLGMAGTLASMGKIEGKSIDIAQAQQIAQQIAEKLQVKALETAASTKDLVGAYQALLGPALAAKMSLNQLIELTVVGVNAVKSMGLPTQQVIQEMRDLVAGGIQASSSTLATAIGVTDKDIAKIKADGKDLFKFLMDRLSGFAASSVLYGDTLTGKFDALKESIELTAQQGFAPLTDALKVWIDEISSSFGRVETVSVKVGDTIKETQKWSLDPAVVTQLRSAADAIVDAGNFALSTARAVYEYRGAVEALAVAWLAVKASQAVGAGAAAVGEFASRIAAEGAAATAALRTTEADAAAAGVAARRAVVERELAMVELGRAQATEAVAAADVAAAVGATELAAANARLTAATASRAVATEQAALATQVMNGSNAAAAASTEALAVAQANAARATTAAGLAMRGGGAIIGALGGPIGIAVTALGALAFAFFSTGSEAEKAAGRAAQAVSDIRAALQKKNKLEAQQLIQKKDAEIAAQGDLLDEANRGLKDNAANLTASKRWKDLVSERSKRLGELRNQRMSMKEELDEWDRVQSQSGKSLPAVTAKFDSAASHKLDELKDKAKTKADKLKEDIDYLKKQVKEGNITADEAEKLEKKLRQKEAGAGKKSTGLTAPDKALADLQARVDAEKQLGEQLAKTGLAHEKLTEGEKLAIKYRQELAVATKTVKKEELERLAKKADELAAQQKQNAAAKEVLALNQEFARSAAQRALDLQQINEEAAKETEWLGLSTEARAVAQAQWELEKQTRREILALQEKMAAAASEEGKAVIAAEIERVRAAASEKSTAVAAATAAKTASSEAARMSQDIERALTDSLMRGFDNGKGAIKGLKDYAVNAFKGWTVKIALQPVMGQVNQVAQQLSTNVSAAMQSGGGIKNLSIGNLFGDTAGGGLQWLAQSGIGQTFGLSEATGALTQAGADLVTSAGDLMDMAGSVGSWVSVGIDAFNSFKTGNGWGKTVGGAIGTYILPGIGTAIGSTLGGLIDSAFGSKGGPKSGGNANAIYGADGQAVAREMFGGYTPNEMDAAFKTAVDGIQAQYATMVKSLGGVAKDLTINLGGDTDPKGNAGNRISAQIAVGQVGAGMGSADAERALWGASAYSKVSASAGSDLTQAVKEESARMLVAALKASDLPADIATAFNSIDVQNASVEQVNVALAQAQALMAVVSAFKSYDSVLPGLAALSLSAKQALVSFSGGIETLQSRLSSYYNNYFSAAEKEFRVRQQVSEKLASVNIALPKTREEFRAVLESLDKSSEAGQRATAAMLEVNEAFASITKSAAELAQVLRDEFSAAAAEAAKTLAALKTARQGILSVDKWLVTAGAGEQAYNDQRRGTLWQMFDGGQLAAEQQLELLQELQGLIQGRYQAEINAVLELTQNAQRLRDAARSIRDYVQSLKTGELSPYTMGERLAESASQFFITVAQARSGDETALGQVQEKASTYLQLGQDYYGSHEGYSGPSGIFANVLATLEGLGLGLDGMSAGQDAAALAAQAQARYSQQAIAEMQRLRAGFASVENVLQNQLVAQTSAAAQILTKMTGPEQLAALRALPAEIAALIRGQLTIQQAAQQAVSQSSSVVDEWYRDSLSREGEAAGKDYWNQTIGRVGQQAAYQSFQYNAQIENNVKSIYREVLGREADAAGAEYWVNQINSGVGYDTARAAIAASDEARARLPQFAVGAERLPSDMVAQLHAGEAVIPAWANTRMLDAVERGAGAPAGGGGDLAGLRAEVQQLREVTERQALMIERLLSALGRAVLDSSADNADRIVDGVAAAGQINDWRAGARCPTLA